MIIINHPDPDGDVAETSVPLVTCLQPDDPAQFIGDHYEDDILCIAPAEGRRRNMKSFWADLQRRLQLI